jgi:hypothetical protein
LELNALVVATKNEDYEDVSPLQACYYQLMQLEEQEGKRTRNMTNRQQIVKKYFDHSATTKHFQKDQWVLLWNKG